MKKIFTRSRSLLVIIALVMIAAMAGIPTARAATSAPGTGNAAGARVASSAQCNLRHTISACHSTNPTVTLSTEATGGTGGVTNCIFVWDILWGDGQSTHVTLTDPADGWHVTAQHTYAATPKTYTVTATGTAAGTNCTLTPFVVMFTLLPPSSSPPPPPSLPTTPSPDFVCVTGPGGSCLGAGAGVPQQDTWAPIPSAWLTSPVTGGCALSVIELLTAIYAPEYEWLVLVEALGGAAYFEQSNGNLIFKLAAAVPFKDCYDLGQYILKHQTPPPGLPLAQKGNPMTNTGALASDASLPSLFQPVSKSQLKRLGKLPFLRKRFGYIVAEVGSEAALSKKYGKTWSSGTHKSVVCQSQRGGYRCNWSFQHDGTHYRGYVLIEARGNSYRLGKVVQL